MMNTVAKCEGFSCQTPDKIFLIVGELSPA